MSWNRDLVELSTTKVSEVRAKTEIMIEVCAEDEKAIKVIKISREKALIQADNLLKRERRLAEDRQRIEKDLAKKYDPYFYSRCDPESDDEFRVEIHTHLSLVEYRPDDHEYKKVLSYLENYKSLKRESGPCPSTDADPSQDLGMKLRLKDRDTERMQ